MRSNFERGDPASPRLLEFLRNSDLDIVMRAGHFEVIAYPTQEQLSQEDAASSSSDSRDLLRNSPAEGLPAREDDRGIRLVQLDAVANAPGALARDQAAA